MSFRKDEGKELHDYSYVDLIAYGDSIHMRMCATRDKVVKNLLMKKYVEITNELTMKEELSQFLPFCLS